MYITMTLPTIFLIILVILGITLTGSGKGITQYTAKFEVAGISSTEAWISAIGQGVFSVGVAQGSSPAFASHSPKRQNFTQDAIIIIVADTIFAFLAGFAVFAVIGHLSTVSGREIKDLPLSGISLAFSTYPVGLSQIGGVGANVSACCGFIFLTLFCTDLLRSLFHDVVVSRNGYIGRTGWGMCRNDVWFPPRKEVTF